MKKNINVKNFLLTLVVFISTQSDFCLGQNYEVGGLLGPRTKTDILMIGNDAENFYSIRIDREKKYFYGSLESYSISKMTKNWSAGFSPQEFDDKFSMFHGIYLTEAGVVYFYTRKGEMPNTIDLVQARFITEGKGRWEGTVLFTLEDMKDWPEITIIQNEEKGIVIAGSEYLQSRLITDKVVKVVQLDPLLNIKFSAEAVLPEKSRFWNVFENDKNIFLLIKNKTPQSFQKVISINTNSKEMKTHDLWMLGNDKKNQNELILQSGFMKSDQEGNNVLCMKMTSSKIGGYNSMNGLGFVTFNSSGEVISRKEIYLPEEYMDGEKVQYNIDLESFEIITNDTYKVNIENNVNVHNILIKNGKLEKMINFSRITAIHDDVNIYYTKQILVDTKERTRLIYNKTATSIGGEDKYEKNFWKYVKGVYAEINEQGVVTEKDLKIEIGGVKNCQIQTTQAIILDNKDVITVAAKDEDLYMIKIYTNKF